MPIVKRGIMFRPIRISRAEYKAIMRAKNAKKKEHLKFLGLHKPLVLTISVLKKRAQALCNLWVKMRDRGMCRVCDKNPVEVAYHILPVGDYPGVRYNEDNIVGACGGCNLHEMLRRMTVQDYWRARIGDEKYDAMKKSGREKTKYTRDELEAIISYYKAKIEGQRPKALMFQNPVDGDGREA